ncbi:MAG TPA: ATP-binding cassette domain-containing protein [Kiritimatiellia bacterium]|nr:ATP-binding cassette domain-containing protein [Kiritimatiellia bacterium]HSA17329.1 ATP-binding cassette domain-containing protein [Kiritimatiellia bacterium]
MIRVTHLTKRFAGCVAVDDVSFRIEPGEVVGFLGVNGAGKTTTLRILSCYLPATSGTAEVAGFDVFRDSLEVRRRIGYLPENAPLYPEMRVDEYLRFRARLKGVSPAACRRRVQEVKDRCGLKDAGRRIIGQLSRGYRQRVGLADCLVHDPELLILDEPTLGLDPAQVIQVRELIRALARRHTILLSTHILPEVEAVCRRVLIINRGRIVASDSPGQLRENLQSGARAVTEIAGPADEVRRGLEALPDVRSVRPDEEDGPWRRYLIEGAHGTDVRPAVFELAARNGWPLRELRQERNTLEEIFVSLTGTAPGEKRP